METAGEMSVTRHSFESLGLPLAYYEWASAAPTPETVVLLHGYLDHALAFAPVADVLARRFRVIAPDHRGHGESGRIGAGGYYHFPDYVFDLARLFEVLELDRAHVVGHSMGASIACYFAGTFPEKVRSLALLDGIGPTAPPHERGPATMRRWVNDVRLIAQREDAPMSSFEEVAERLQRMSPYAPRDRLLALAKTAAEETLEGLRWKFDPLHRTTAPVPFDAARFAVFLANIACPTLLVWGEHTPLKPSDLDARKRLIIDLNERTLPGAAHNLHHERPSELAVMLAEFLESRLGMEPG
jgi:pimeloyl-ACP methyl ester carboxylesterase